MSIVIVTGTGTGVGKTVATAALVVRYQNQGKTVQVVKPTQSGVKPSEPGDLDDVRTLAGPVTAHELVRLEHPLSPDAAARHAGVAIPGVEEHAATIGGISRNADLTLVEGAGGILVRLDTHGGTLADLACHLRDAGHPVTTVVVSTAGLGSLNHAALTVEALRRRDLDIQGVIVGAFPQNPGLAEQLNLHDLPLVTGVPLLFCIPDGAGSWPRESFTEAAPTWQ